MYVAFNVTLISFFIAENKTEEAIKTIVNRIVSLPTELKVRALKTIEILLHVDDIVSQVTAVTFKWYKAMGDNLIDKITTYAKNPFGEVRCAGLGILSSLALQQWGQEVIQSVPGKQDLKTCYLYLFIIMLFFRIGRISVG